MRSLDHGNAITIYRMEPDGNTAEAHLVPVVRESAPLRPWTRTPSMKSSGHTQSALSARILSRVRQPMHTGQLEGINNKITVIKRQAFGLRDAEYFFLKIKPAFPGNP